MRTNAPCKLRILPLLPGAALVFFTGLSGHALTIRHDQSDLDYQNLALAYESVGKFSSGTAGTLIAPNWVLTAAHVAEGLNLGTGFFTVGNTSYNLAETVIHSSYVSVAQGNDIALVRLQQSVGNVTPATYYTGNLELTQVGTSVSFGMTGTGLTGATGSDGLKRAMQNSIDLFGDGTALLPMTTFLSDFDNPQNPLDSTSGLPGPLLLEGLSANGDSGGGVFIDVGMGPVLAGIHSYVLAPRDGGFDSDYGDIMGSTRVSLYDNFIQSTIQPIPEPSVTGLAALGGMLGWAMWRRRRKTRK